MQPNVPHHLPRKRAKPDVAGQVQADVMRHLLEGASSVRFGAVSWDGLCILGLSLADHAP